jgi:hypothetical protein
MLKIFKFIGYFLERSERNQPRTFWFCSCLLGFFIFHEPLTTSSQSQPIIEQVPILRGGETSEKKNFDQAFHLKLEKHFPDWSGRMKFQKKQEIFYKSALQKKGEIKRVRMKEEPKLYTKEELDAIDYFQGNGIYAKYQHEKEKYNVFDTRQSFLRKMHDPIELAKFLDSFNCKTI